MEGAKGVGERGDRKQGGAGGGSVERDGVG